MVESAGNADTGRNVNVKLIALGVLGAVLVLFALLNTHEVGVDWIFDTVSAPLILVIVGVRGHRVPDGFPRAGALREPERLTGAPSFRSWPVLVPWPPRARVRHA